MQNAKKKSLSHFILKQLKKTLIIFTIILIILTFALYSFVSYSLHYSRSDRAFAIADAIMNDILDDGYDEQQILDKLFAFDSSHIFPEFKTGSAFRILDIDGNVIFETCPSIYAYIGYSVIGEVPEALDLPAGNHHFYVPVANIGDCIEAFEKYYGKYEIYVVDYYMSNENTSVEDADDIINTSIYLGNVTIFDEEYNIVDQFDFTPSDTSNLYRVEDRPILTFFGTDYDLKAKNILNGENEDLKFGTYYVPVGCGFVRDNSLNNYYYSSDADSTTITYTDDESGYTVEAVVVFDVLPGVIRPIIIMWVIGIILALIITYVTAHIKYNKYSAQYEVDLYRQNLTNALAHDLKTPLTAICGYAQNLKDNVNTDKKDYYADAVLENAQYMNRIISDTLELSKLEYQDSIRKEEVDILALTNELSEKYKPLADEENKSFAVSGKCTVKADRALISRAIENLITNSLRYSLPDSVIKISADSKVFVMKNRCKDNIVGDEKLFCEPFKKADSSRSNNSGTGIGLSIVKSITTLHGFGLEIKAENSEFMVKIIF